MNITGTNNSQPKFGMNTERLVSTLKDIPSKSLRLTEDLVDVVGQLAKHNDKYEISYEPFTRTGEPLNPWKRYSPTGIATSRFQIKDEETNIKVILDVKHYFKSPNSVAKKITKVLRSLLNDNKTNKLFEKQRKVDAAKDAIENKQKALANRLAT